MTKKKGKKAKPDYVATAREAAAMRKFLAHHSDKASPRIKACGGLATSWAVDHPAPDVGFALVMEALGTSDWDFAQGLLDQICVACMEDGKISEAKVNFVLSVIKGWAPKDPFETMLTTQMALVQMSTAKFSQLLSNADTLPFLEGSERTFTKLARTFVMQMETLKRYRTGGEQKVTVQHVSVSEGGQAILGNITQASEASKDDAVPKAPLLAIADTRSTPMPIIDAGKSREGLAQRGKCK